jgi:hypothetical protein
MTPIGCAARRGGAGTIARRAACWRWHKTDKLKVLRNITIILPPSRSPELSPVKNVWQFLRQNWLSNRLVALPEAINSINMRDWAHPRQQSLPPASEPAPKRVERFQ